MRVRQSDRAGQAINPAGLPNCTKEGLAAKKTGNGSKDLSAADVQIWEKSPPVERHDMRLSNCWKAYPEFLMAVTQDCRYGPGRGGAEKANCKSATAVSAIAGYALPTAGN
jgi:hypothetical protein